MVIVYILIMVKEFNMLDYIENNTMIHSLSIKGKVLKEDIGPHYTIKTIRRFFPQNQIEIHFNLFIHFKLKFHLHHILKMELFFWKNQFLLILLIKVIIFYYY